MMKGFFVCLFILSGFFSQAQAKTLELKKNTRSIYIKDFKDWSLSRDLFGMPFIYFSPRENGQRSNISFTDTGADLELDLKALAANQKDYQTGKKKWAGQVGAMTLSFSPYHVSVNKHGHKIHKIGFSYEYQGKVYAERSYYIECRGKILFSKSLRLRENVQHEKDFQDLIYSLDCGGV